jgi:VanZ family protein
VLGWAALIFAGSSIPMPPQPPEVKAFPWDKFAHAIEYAVFGWLLFRAFLAAEQFSVRRSAWLAILFAAMYGLSDETHQFFVGRDCDWGDLIADIVGATAAGVALALLEWGRSRVTTPEQSVT